MGPSPEKGESWRLCKKGTKWWKMRIRPWTGSRYRLTPGCVRQMKSPGSLLRLDGVSSDGEALQKGFEEREREICGFVEEEIDVVARHQECHKLSYMCLISP